MRPAWPHREKLNFPPLRQSSTNSRDIKEKPIDRAGFAFSLVRKKKDSDLSSPVSTREKERDAQRQATDAQEREMEWKVFSSFPRCTFSSQLLSFEIEVEGRRQREKGEKRVRWLTRSINPSNASRVAYATTRNWNSERRWGQNNWHVAWSIPSMKGVSSILRLEINMPIIHDVNELTEFW